MGIWMFITLFWFYIQIQYFILILYLYSIIKPLSINYKKNVNICGKLLKLGIHILHSHSV